MPNRNRLLATLLLAWAWLGFAGVAGAAPRIGVMTMQPGEIFFERFGHNALVVDDPALPGPVSYNYGFFDMDEPGFLPRFIRGDMAYQLVALPLAQDLVYYGEVGRGVSIQWLALDDAQATRLAARLAENARPENARYRYDYFTDNCSTRVRDGIDFVLDGALRRQLSSRSRGNTYRGDAVRLASPAPWMWLGFDIGLGPSADRPHALWEDGFVPMRLAAALRETRLADGQPLVAEEVELLPHRLPPEPAESPRAWWPWLIAGVAIGFALVAAGRRTPRIVAALALPAWTLAGLLGAVMALLWLGTDHRFAWANQNLWLLNPLAWILLPGAWRIARGRAPGRAFRIAGLAVVALACCALFVHWLPLQPQRNAHWIALLLPVQLGFFLALRRPR